MPDNEHSQTQPSGNYLEIARPGELADFASITEGAENIVPASITAATTSMSCAPTSRG